MANNWRASLKVDLKVGLVMASDCPMYTAVDSGEKVELNNLHVTCKHKVSEKLYCSHCAEEIMDKQTQLVKGFKQGKDDYIVLTEAEIASCKKDSNQVLNCVQFIEEGVVNPVLYQKPNYLVAGDKSVDLYGLIQTRIEANGVIGLAKMVSRQKDHFYVVAPRDGILVAFELYFPNMIRKTDELEKAKADGFDADTVKMFDTLIKKMTKPFDETKIVDEYTDALKSIIKAKAEGRVIDISQPTVVKKKVSLKDALAASLAMDAAA